MMLLSLMLSHDPYITITTSHTQYVTSKVPTFTMRNARKTMNMPAYYNPTTLPQIPPDTD